MEFPKFQDFNFDSKNPSKKVALDPLSRIPLESAMGLYTEMVRLRRCEEALLKEYHPADEMRCPVHFCIGQEALPSVLAILLQNDDYLFCHHRSHGYYLAKVHSMDGIFAEMYGKENGANGGKAGSQDVSCHRSNFFSGAILAGTVPIAAGAAFALRQKKKEHVVIAATGEGALDEGVYWETLNYAAVKKLPIVFVCENNFYSTYSPQNHRSSSSNLSERVEKFGVKASAFFGNDVVKSFVEVQNAIRWAREGKGPVFLEAFTYRMNAHVGPESDEYIGYRSPAEIDYWKRHCPILLLEERLLAEGALTAPQIEAVAAKVDKEIADAFVFAKSGLFPQIPNWEKFNFCGESKLADRLLSEEKSVELDGHQKETVPAPY